VNHKVNLEVFARFDLWRRFDYQVGTLLFSFNIDLIRKLFEVHGEQLKQDNQTVMQEARTIFAGVPSMGDEPKGKVSRPSVLHCQCNID